MGVEDFRLKVVFAASKLSIYEKKNEKSSIFKENDHETLRLREHQHPSLRSPFHSRSHHSKAQLHLPHPAQISVAEEQFFQKS